jgi:hypothetical protein
MIDQVPSVFPEIYYKGIDFWLWLIAISIGILGSIMFYLRMKKQDTAIQKTISLGIANILLFFSMMRILYILAVRLPGHNYDFFTGLGYATGLLGLTGFVFSAERYLLHKTKFLLTIIGLVGVIAGFLAAFGVLSRDYVVNITGIVAAIIIGFILLISIWLIVHIPGDLRKRMFIVVVGIILIYLADVLDSQRMYTLIIGWPIFIAPLCMIVGIILLVWAMQIKY